MARRLPAEWECQDGVLLCWPHRGTDWVPHLAAVEAVYTELIGVLARLTSVLVVAREPDRVSEVLHRREGRWFPNLRLFPLDSDDTWARDFGPICVYQESQPLLLDFTFNGWGGKFPAARDDRITAQLHAAGAFGDTPREVPGFVLEGGSIDSDGQGSLLTTERCLLHPRRNPHLDRRGVERELHRWLGTERVLWLEHGELQGDDTDAHVDTLARFAAEDTIVYQSCDDGSDPHYEPLSNMASQLAGFRTMQGEPYRLLPLPWPRARYEQNGRRLPATYANFLVTNGAVLLPFYGDPNDSHAAEILQTAFPGRRVIGVSCAVLLQQHGSLHCLTMQLPRGVLS